MIQRTGTLETSPTRGLLPCFREADGQHDYPYFPGAVGSGSLDSSRNLLIAGASGQLRTGHGASSFSLSHPPSLTLCCDHQEDLPSAVGRKGPQGRPCLSPGVRGSQRAVSTGGTGSCWGNKPPPSSAAQHSGLCSCQPGQGSGLGTHTWGGLSMLLNISGAGEYQGWRPALSGGLCTHTSAGEAGRLRRLLWPVSPGDCSGLPASWQPGVKSELPKRARWRQDQPVRAGFS